MKKSVPQLVIIVGVMVLLLSLIWWQQTFGFEADYIKCFAFSGGVCRVGSIGKIFGGAGYNPLFFWVGLIFLGSGVLLKKSKLL
jgi:fucose 4-O-acetylase-like acetyltransferase